MRNRGSVVLVENQKVGLIKRVRGDSVYYVFPGGGIEDGETPQEAAKREAQEELGVTVNINECIAEVEFNGTQYFFLAEIITGNFGTGNGEEYTDFNRKRGTYLPLWIEINQLSSIDVKPKEVAIKIQALFN
ncbi:NUDIX domain-containing protein [Fictibacillus sp. KIGAM418]|uniref:NUDIX domain-containing protein n=1 Tax=Fictibacillus marinisediminis TaxID=2878389 RepID=A0A9X2BFZ8_9BACL|nr:NUDIX domain-containing protein [Fictibacillus marinisediminis]MCK6257802.1 NUDIX domain-containing protein [Fictibacillus marinisediminis]